MIELHKVEINESKVAKEDNNEINFYLQSKEIINFSYQEPELSNSSDTPEFAIHQGPNIIDTERKTDKIWKNKLILGDNKIVMSALLKEFAGKINLIYIDPPFATGSNFKLKLPIGDSFEENKKKPFFIEEKAYSDIWGKNLNNYLQIMYERLVLMKELLSENGSIYVHLDWHVVHYIKVIMDEIFGYDNFINEIIWFFKGTSNSCRMYADKHDNILFYAKNKDKYIFNADAIRIPYKNLKAYKQDETGKWYKQWAKGKKYYPPQDYINGKWVLKGKYRYDVIDDVASMSTAHGNEYLGFSTQKKEELLKIFILASSNPSDIVADFFCGSGTTLAVAEKLGRRWIGCDVSRYAIHITKKRLLDIENSKDLFDKTQKYNKKVRPFEVLYAIHENRQLLSANNFANIEYSNKNYPANHFQNNYLETILKLYGANPFSISSNCTKSYWCKNNALVYVFSTYSKNTINEILSAVSECKSLNKPELHILGFNWEFTLYSKIQELSLKEPNIKLRLIKIHIEDSEFSNSFNSIRFFEMGNFKVDVYVNKNDVSVKLLDFTFPNYDLLPTQIINRISNWSDLIDYWAIDFDYNNKIFNTHWISYKTNKNRRLNLLATHTYSNSGKYRICIKVVDIFSTEVVQIVDVNIN